MPFTPEQFAEAQNVQETAAHDEEQQVRLIAGPGSGKSRTIEERIRWLLENGVAPQWIAVVSFTNASAIDLRLRIRAYRSRHGQDGGREVPVTTLHSLALRVLRQAGLLQQYPTRPVVLDDWELEHIYDAEFGFNQGITSSVRREQIRRFYEAFWSTGVPNAPTYVPPDPPITRQEQQRFDAFHPLASQVYSCVLPGEILRRCVDSTLAGVINPAELLQLRYLVVDEYQDLNPADLQFVDQMAAAGVRIFVAGDDDQSIYSFRHASPAGIQGFATNYPGAALHELKHCFRCTPAVLAAAANLIVRNAAPGRIPKRLVSLYERSAPPVRGVVQRWRFRTAYQEAEAIARSCADLIAAGLPPHEILVLLATRNPSVALWSLIRAAFVEAGVPFDPPKEESFADSEAGRLVLAVTRIVCSRNQDGMPQDLIAHRTLLGLRRGVGVATCDAIRRAIIATPNLNLLRLIYEPLPNGLLAGNAPRAVNAARQVCERLRVWHPDDTLEHRTDEIAAIVEATLTPAAAEQWRAFSAPLVPGMSLAELQDYLWVDNAQQREEVLRAVRDRLGIEQPEAEAIDNVRVMTMHGAKGLSGTVVFIPGLEEGLLPNRHQAPYASLVLEAARLLYVSITRARAGCILSFAGRRTIYGRSEHQDGSRFAAQTGGAFGWKEGGLTAEDVRELMAAVRLLHRD